MKIHDRAELQVRTRRERIPLRLAALLIAIVATTSTAHAVAPASAFVLSSNANNGSFGSLPSICAPGEWAIGGGIDVFNVFAMTVTSDTPLITVGSSSLRPLQLLPPSGPYGLPTGRYVATRNDGSSNGLFKSAALCVPAIGSVVTQVETTFVQGLTLGGRTVSCGDGLQAIGGGVDLSNVFNLSVTTTTPVIDGDRPVLLPDGQYGAPSGWAGFARAETVTPGEIAVVAVCEPSAPGIVTVVESAVAPVGSFAAHRVTCPTDMFAIGGGVDALNVLNMAVTSNGPVFDDGGTLSRLMLTPNGTQSPPVGWQGSVRNDSNPDGTFKVSAICVPEPVGGLSAGLLGLCVLGGTRTRGRRPAIAARRRPRA